MESTSSHAEGLHAPAGYATVKSGPYKQWPTALEHFTMLRVFEPAARVRKTSIIATLGPASRDVGVLKQMIRSGMNIARLNFSHGDYEYHKGTVTAVREAIQQVSSELGYNVQVAIALDIRGAKIRVGVIAGQPNGEVELRPGAQVKLTINEKYKDASTSELIYVDYPKLPQVVKAGRKIFMDDGLLCLRADSIGGDYVMCTVENGGKLGSRKGVNLPNTNVDLPAVSKKDEADLRFGVEMGVDIVFASFIRDAGGVHEVRKALGDEGKGITVIAKIESRQGVENLDEIIEASDGIMVARGDLAVEIPDEKVFLAQKLMCAKANMVIVRFSVTFVTLEDEKDFASVEEFIALVDCIVQANKPVIVATQMLESMTEKPRPTRAEVSDVGNAVLDGADCVMLSAETAKGLYPVRSVLMQHQISLEAEGATYHRQFFDEIRRALPIPMDNYYTLAASAVEASVRIRASAIICVTTSGRTCRAVSMFRPRCPIFGVTRDARVARQLHLYRAVLPILYEPGRDPNWMQDVDNRVKACMHAGKARGIIRDGDAVIVITGWAMGSGFTNTMRILYAPDLAGEPPSRPASADTEQSEQHPLEDF